MAFLTEQIAKTLCTAITLGFVKANNVSAKNYKVSNNRDIPTQYLLNIQYASDEADATLIGNKFKELDPDAYFIPGRSASQDTMPLITAKTAGTSSFADATKLLDETVSYRRNIEALAKKQNLNLELPLRGAYIGTTTSTSKAVIVGPSALELYPPQYRDITATQAEGIKKAYNDSVNVTNALIKIVTQYIPTSGKFVKADKLNMPEAKQLDTAKNLFKSYHGMTQVIVNYGAGVDSSAVICEIALGAETSKVSSCLPCSMFMVANGTAPSSTHLGRGDNWGIPKGQPVGSMVTAAWRKNIIAYYESGRDILAKYSDGASIGKYLAPTKDNLSAIKDSLTAIKSNAKQDLSDIPDIFLEALTFESSFSEKILGTLGR